MKIPDKIKIGAHLFDVEQSSENETGYDKSGSKFGWRAKIRIQKDMVQSKKEATLFHEILHEIDYQHALELDERMVSTISESFYELLKDNDLLK